MFLLFNWAFLGSMLIFQGVLRSTLGKTLEFLKYEESCWDCDCAKLATRFVEIPMAHTIHNIQSS